MSASLARQLIEARGSRRAARAPNPAGMVPDQVTFDAGVGPLLLALLERVGLSRVRVGFAFAGLEPEGEAGGFEHTPGFRARCERARALGIHVARPGSGSGDAIHRERFAAPGKLVFTLGRGTPSAGALGSLPLPVGLLEGVAALAGHPIPVPDLAVHGVELHGSWAAWMGGLDVMLELARRASRDAGISGIIEFLGPGVIGMPFEERIRVCVERAALGAAAVLFPSDESTRRFLAAQGRDADWKPLQPPERGRYQGLDALDLHQLEPMIAPADDLAAARPVRRAQGVAVRRVALSHEASLSDLALLARGLADRGVHSGTELWVRLGNRRVREVAAAGGILEPLEAAGAHWFEPGGAADPMRRAEPGMVGVCSTPPASLPGAGRSPWMVASVATCAAAAATGRIADPRELDDRSGEVRVWPALARAQVFPPIPEAQASPDERSAGPVRFASQSGALRGAVLASIGNHVWTSSLLVWGPKVEREVADLSAVASRLLAELDPGFATRARLQGGGFLVGGRELGAGARAELVALALAELSVKAVMAHSFAPGFAKAIALAGVLPLERSGGRSREDLMRGDELEIPGWPDTLEWGKPLTVRNLTRGTQFALTHGLGPDDLEVLRAGGVLALGVAEPHEMAR